MRRKRRSRTTGAKPAVAQSNLRQRRRGSCKGCGQTIEAGDPIVKLTLRKVHRVPCVTCSHVPVGTKRYHPDCVPSDINKAMGYDPLARQRAAYHQHTPDVTTAPPPKPKTSREADLTALDALQQALILKAKPMMMLPPTDPRRVELESQFKTFQGIKARMLRPGTDAEGAVATSLALQRIVKLVYSN